MTGRLRPWDAIDPYQHKATDDLFAHDERLALLETGSGKTMIAMTAGEELRQQGIVKRPLVFAPLRVAQITWPDERFEWVHLKDVPMVCWGGAPEDWEPSLWRQSRTLWGQRTSAENALPGVEKRVLDDLAKQVEAKARADGGDAFDDEQHAQHVTEHYRRKHQFNPNQIKDAVSAALAPVEARLAAATTDERKVNRVIRNTEPPESWHVTSFENVMWLTDLYPPGESPFDLWIVDETGKVARNPKSPRYKALKKHMPKAKLRWGMNATPAPEGCEDLFGQVQLVAGKSLWGGSFYQWRQKFFVPADYMGYTYRLQLGAFDMLMADLNKVAFRVPAEALSYQKSIRHSQIPVVLPPKARAAYEDMAKQMAVEIDGLGDVVAMSEATASQKLRQITQGFLYETDAKGRRIVHHMHDEKTNALAELIDSMGREPLLVGFQFDEDLENIKRIWKNVPHIGKGVSSATVAEHMARFNKRELPVLAAHHDSISHGVNLQYGCHHVCHLALPWGLDPYKQFNERLDRRGQTHQVFGHHIIALDSKDQQVSDALIEKNVDQNRVIQAIRSV